MCSSTIKFTFEIYRAGQMIAWLSMIAVWLEQKNNYRLQNKNPVSMSVSIGFQMLSNLIDIQWQQKWWYYSQSINETGQLSLPHTGITETEKIELKRKTDELISLVNSLEPWDQSDRQKQTKVEDKIFWKGWFWAQSETLKKWWKVIALCSKLNRHV